MSFVKDAVNPEVYKPNCVKCKGAGNGQRKPGAVGPRQAQIPRQPILQNLVRPPNPIQN